MLKGNLIFGQSGGPTSVINASAAGVFLEALEQTEAIEHVYGAHHGIVGVLEEDFFDMGEEDPAELRLLKQTPSSALGSCRYKLADPEDDPTDYERIYEVFKKYNIRYFLYNGGNDSMDTCAKISGFLAGKDWDCRVMGVPKTIDNDLVLTDHCPGYGSAARYIATTLMEVAQDANVYHKPQITIVEIMGRNAGWLTAAAELANYGGAGPDLIYLPERAFDVEQCVADTKAVLEKQGKVLIAISEGVRTADGKTLLEYTGELSTDAFGHVQLGGVAGVLEDILAKRFDVKIRSIELSLMQRCSAHLASATDVEEAFLCGREAVRAAVRGESGYMIAMRRPETGLYHAEYALAPLADVANAEKKVPDYMINEAGNGILPSFVDYALPLIQGRPDLLLRESLPVFSKLKRVQAGKQR